MAQHEFQHILITGPPGVGKTTLLRNVAQMLVKSGVRVSGFYTADVRDQHGERTGFQVSSLSGSEQGVLATTSCSQQRQPKVGKYFVNIANFERIALPALQVSGSAVIAIDEIGKMELLSKPFAEIVESFFSQNVRLVLATIPMQKGAPLPVVDRIRSLSNVEIYTANRDNRSSLVSHIHNKILSTFPIPTDTGT